MKFFTYSVDGDGGFPGDVYIEVTYTMSTDKNEFFIEYKANTTKQTPIDLTNHAYFNLAGHNSREKIYNHFFKIYSDFYLGFDESTLTVTGNINSVNSSKYDFRHYTRLGDRIDQTILKWPDEGFDNYFILNQQSGNKVVASFVSILFLFYYI